MHHKKTAGSPKRTIKGIGETRIERKVFTGNLGSFDLE
jgi:hypothetical protein